MTHVFNPGDLAYSLIKNKWVQLSKNNNPSIFNLSLRDEDSDNLYMDDGKVRLYDHPILLPLNPYDPTDPNNPPEFRNPFLHEGRLVKIGDDMANKITGRYLGEVFKMMVEPPSRSYLFIVGPNGGNTWEVGNKDLTFSDSLPKKKITYLWAIPVFGIPGSVTVDFKRMTQEEGEKVWGAKIVPDSEKEES